MDNLRVINSPTSKTFTICLSDGAKITIAALSYFISDDGTYAFCELTDDELGKRLWKGAIVTPLFEIPKKLVAMIFENSDKIQFEKRKRSKITKVNPVINPAKKRKQQ